MKTIALGFLASAIAATSVLAGDEVVSKDYKQPTPPSTCFKDQEIQVDLFGSFANLPYGHDQYYTNSRQTRLFHDDNRDGGGGGVGVNYFFMRYFGVGVDGDFDSNVGGIANYTGKIILRLPIEAGGFCIAPYVFAGGGGESLLNEDDYGWYNYHGRRVYRNNSSTVGAWMVGGGLEWRITPMVGIFAEARYTWTARYHGEEGLNFDNDIARLGVRLSF
jgi:Outer membrane protein beta-barrel domain